MTFIPEHPHADADRRRPILARLASRWWQMALVWVVVFALVAFGIVGEIPPAYEAVALLEARSIEDIFAPELHAVTDPRELVLYLRTQVGLIRSDRTLEAALAMPQLVRLPMITSSPDAKETVRKRLRAEIVEDTGLIRVALESTNPAEAAAIVNAVVNSYIEQHRESSQTASRSLKKELEAERAKLGSQIQSVRSQLTDLIAHQNASAGSRVVVRPVGKDDEGPSLKAVTPEQHRDLINRLIQADFERMDARAQLEVAKRPDRRESDGRIRELETSVLQAEQKSRVYARYIGQLRVEPPTDAGDDLQVSMLRQDLNHLRELQKVAESKYSRLLWKINRDSYRVVVHDKAAVPKVPSSDPRPAYLASAAAVTYLLVLGVFLIIEIVAEIAAGRVDEPDAEA